MEVSRVSPTAQAVGNAPHGNTPHGNPALTRAVAAVNSANLFGDGREVTLAIDRDTHLIVARLVDRQTGTVIQQIPPQYLLDLARDLARASPAASDPVR